ncbi:hypothetical protein [Tropicibacter alexandrii]|uniref:hypothetical protein n=1 Tax=Tropicibacter alexandrii TaxID=2267683 RepID=UPI000EF48BB1|nr:hypothetical protein [Tropicibacter alexandrii]
MTAERFMVVRVPGSGPPALIGAPYDFATLADAKARIAEIEATHRKSHHTHLEIVPYRGALAQALAERGILA